MTHLGGCQQTRGDAAFAGHDDTVLGENADAGSRIVDCFNGILDLFMTVEE
jgi:hypothetical protein